MDVLDDVRAEMESADANYGPPTSAHESFGVLSEEVAELLEAIRSNKSESVREEAIQVAAVALRLAHSCRAHLNFQRRSGFKWQ
jgi:NTP pyrophosphatase (non-canonical NTP hydrolase)